jgi:hypothetical protein
LIQFVIRRVTGFRVRCRHLRVERLRLQPEWLTRTLVLSIPGERVIVKELALFRHVAPCLSSFVTHLRRSEGDLGSGGFDMILWSLTNFFIHSASSVCGHPGSPAHVHGGNEEGRGCC